MFKHQRLLSTLLLAAFLVPACKGSDNSKNTQKTNTTKTVTVREKVAEGLDLSQLPELVSEAEDAEELEQLLNTADINNLDLNDDDQIDYLNVEEYREGADRGFLLYTQEKDAPRTELAQVLISQQSETADVVVKGNPDYYGNQSQYRSSFPLGQILLAGWLFNMARPRYYHAPYYVGSYPRYYRSRRPVSSSLYRSRLRSASSTRSRLNSSNSRPTTTYKSTTTSKSGANKAAGTSSGKSLNAVQGNSFSTTSKKRPARSGSSTGSSFGSSSSRNSSSGSGSSTGSSFGSSSSRSRSTGSSSSRSSFGSSSRRSSSSGRRRR
jgi:hypothetical protein